MRNLMNVTKEKESKLINIQIKMTQIVFLKKKSHQQQHVYSEKWIFSHRWKIEHALNLNIQNHKFYYLILHDSISFHTGKKWFRHRIFGIFSNDVRVKITAFKRRKTYKIYAIITDHSLCTFNWTKYKQFSYHRKKNDQIKMVIDRCLIYGCSVKSLWNNINGIDYREKR